MCSLCWGQSVWGENSIWIIFCKGQNSDLSPKKNDFVFHLKSWLIKICCFHPFSRRNRRLIAEFCRRDSESIWPSSSSRWGSPCRCRIASIADRSRFSSASKCARRRRRSRRSSARSSAQPWPAPPTWSRRSQDMAHPARETRRKSSSPPPLLVIVVMTSDSESPPKIYEKEKNYFELRKSNWGQQFLISLQILSAELFVQKFGKLK